MNSLFAPQAAPLCVSPVSPSASLLHPGSSQSPGSSHTSLWPFPFIVHQLSHPVISSLLFILDLFPPLHPHGYSSGAGGHLLIEFLS